MRIKSTSWRLIPFILAAGLILWFPIPASFAAPTARTLRIDASRFQFSPAVLQINPGDTVTIELASQDVVHGLSIDDYDVHMTADPGQTAKATFIANKAGSFRFRCTVTCGNMHPFMIGKLQVGVNTFFWRAAGMAVLALIAGIWKLHA